MINEIFVLIDFSFCVLQLHLQVFNFTVVCLWVYFRKLLLCKFRLLQLNLQVFVDFFLKLTNFFFRLLDFVRQFLHIKLQIVILIVWLNEFLCVLCQILCLDFILGLQLPQLALQSPLIIFTVSQFTFQLSQLSWFSLWILQHF